MILFSRFWGENISGLFKTSQVLNSSFKCVDKLYIFNALMIINNIITTIMGVKGKVNTVMKLTEYIPYITHSGDDVFIKNAAK